MTRVEENQIIYDQWKNLSFTGKPEAININLKIAEINVLMDISKSLAMIADMNFISLPINKFNYPVNIGDNSDGK